MAWAVGCCPLLIVDAVQSMKGGAVPSEMSRQLRSRYVTALIVQQRTVSSASSVTVLQFFSRMKRAMKGYDTAFQDTGPGRELREGLTSDTKLWSGIMAEMKRVVDIFVKLSESVDLCDLPIGQGMASTDWQVLVATGESPRGTDTRKARRQHPGAHRSGMDVPERIRRSE